MNNKSTTNTENANQSITSNSLEKFKDIKITDNVSEISHEKIDNFIPNAVNPNNNAAFEEKSNPLSSKGN